ncbi:MAG TPA: glycosyl hydrolase, partial [Desulfitobacteriaceae bacterium]|nr:glycosyl hydrolase [Desulfitobacteriaceae bacterium]
MFRYRIISLIALLALLLGVLCWTWKTPQVLALPSVAEIGGTQRWSQDLSGTWDKYSTVGQAWKLESQFINGHKPLLSLFGPKHFQLPSNQRFSVAARSFRIPAEWSARTVQLAISGVNGHAAVYLNGADQSRLLGEFEGSGAQNLVEIPAAALRYGEDNVLLIQLTAAKAQEESLFSLTWPNTGQIGGQIRLEAVVETSLTNPLLNVTWSDDKAAVTVETQLIHHNLTEKGPWTLRGILTEGSTEIARDSLQVNPDGNYSQNAVLKFYIRDGQRWNRQNPFLYQLQLTVSNSKGDQDDLNLPIGLRSLALTEGKWLLNQEAVDINGSVLSAEREAQLRNGGEIQSFIKSELQKGVNLLYFLGTYPDELWLQTADQMGMGIWVEWPIGMVPASRLPAAAEFEKLVTAGSRHPSIWAWTIGKGLENSPKTTAFLNEAEKLITTGLALELRLASSAKTDFPENSFLIEGDTLKGSWGQVVNEEGNVARPVSWPQEGLASLVWALLMLFLSGMNLRTISWRYKQLSEKKPKRRLRQAWYWQNWAFLAREGTLAGIITAAFYHLPIDWGTWFLYLWPGLVSIQSQSPWLLWAVLTLILIILRLLQVGLVSWRFPGSPHPLGLIYWLERRYRWVILVALLWALVPWGIPLFTPLGTYLVLNLLFLPLRIRDVHRIDGHYRPLLLLPALLGACLAIWCISRWADWLFLWHIFM